MLQEIKNFKELYRIEKLLGTGNFSEIFLVTRKDDLSGKKEKYVLKRIKQSDYLLFKNEITFTKVLQESCSKGEIKTGYDSLVKIKGYFSNDDGHHLLMEYVEGVNGSIFVSLHVCGKATEHDFVSLHVGGKATEHEIVKSLIGNTNIERKETIRKILEKLVMAIECIHELGYINTDLSLDNLIITCDTQKNNTQIDLKVIDLGMVQKIDSKNIIIGKLRYLAPEILNITKYKEKGIEVHANKFGVKSDLWALGIISFILLTGSHPFNAVTDAIFLAKISQFKINYNNYDLNRAEKKFLKSLLKKNPEKRKIRKEFFIHLSKW